MADTLSLKEFNSEQIIMPKRNIRAKYLTEIIIICPEFWVDITLAQVLHRRLSQY